MGTFGPKNIANSGASTTQSLDDRDSDWKKVARVPSGIVRVVVAVGLYAFTNISKIEIWRGNERIYGPITAQMAAAFDPEKIAPVGVGFSGGDTINIELTSTAGGAGSADIYVIYQDVR